jgi:hypothetical protein
LQAERIRRSARDLSEGMASVDDRMNDAVAGWLTAGTFAARERAFAGEPGGSSLERDP